MCYSGNQHLDQLQSLALFLGFLLEGYRGSLKELGVWLSSETGRSQLLTRVREYYYCERLCGLRCLKHLLGYWQDPSHPHRVNVGGEGRGGEGRGGEGRGGEGD